MAEKHDATGLPINAGFRVVAWPRRQPVASVAGTVSSGSIPVCAPAASDDRSAPQPARLAGTCDRAQCTALAEWEGEGGRIPPA